MNSARFTIVVAALVLGGCVRTSVMPMAADTVQITARAAPICGGEGAERVAFERAAIETIRRGYDRFVLLNGLAQNNIKVGSHVYGNAYGVYSSPWVYGTHDQALIVKMFRDKDPMAKNALSARATLGSAWQQRILDNRDTCTTTDQDGDSYRTIAQADTAPEPAQEQQDPAARAECLKSEASLAKWARDNGEKFVSRCN